jgi:guanyl-specific ribonuclease Sa
MSKLLRLAVVVVVVVFAAQWWNARPSNVDVSTKAFGHSASDTTGATSRYPAFLPPEAIATLQAIERGGPFQYDRDGSTFQNRERRLPDRARGYYREYTVETPGSPDRGARRIVAGGDPPEVYYYTDDHYRSFQPFELQP